MPIKYSISDLASEFQVTARAIRFYEEKGLLKPKRSGSARIFSANDRVKLKLILRGKSLGLSLDESRDIIDMYDPKSANMKQLKMLLSKIHGRQSLLEKQRKEINAMLKDLRAAEANCKNAMLKSKTSTNL